VAAVPKLKALAAKYSAQGLVVVGASLDAEPKVKQFKQVHGIGYALLASAGKSAEAYGVQAYPTMFLVGKDGKILWKGHFEDVELFKAIDLALAAK
jgi:peroxiredoxin